MLKVIASYANTCRLDELENNLPRFYTNQVEQNVLYANLASLEEEGIIYEFNGQYSVHEEYLPIEVVNL